jgi:hypothetical protein
MASATISGTPKTSARICRQTGLFAPPPLARTSWIRPASLPLINSKPSRRPNATPSITARVRWARLWRAVRPMNAPRASGSGCGVRSPVR